MALVLHISSISTEGAMVAHWNVAIQNEQKPLLLDMVGLIVKWPSFFKELQEYDYKEAVILNDFLSPCVFYWMGGINCIAYCITSSCTNVKKSCNMSLSIGYLMFVGRTISFHHWPLTVYYVYNIIFFPLRTSVSIFKILNVLYCSHQKCYCVYALYAIFIVAALHSFELCFA